MGFNQMSFLHIFVISIKRQFVGFYNMFGLITFFRVVRAIPEVILISFLKFTNI